MARIITDYLEESAKRFPNKPAFIDSTRSVTFAELQTEAKSIATFLIQSKTFKRSVAVYLDKSVSSIAAFLGVAYSGNFYTVIDTKMPSVRIRRIIETLQPDFIITDAAHEISAREFCGDVKLVRMEELMKTAAEDETVLQTTNRIIDTDVLYVLFTSGSTGTPKGVVIGHRAVVDYIEWFTETFQFDEHHVFGNQAPFFFDVSVTDIYCTLKVGATTHIIPQKCFAFPVTLMNYIKDNAINSIFFVPTVLCRVADLGLLEKCDVSCLQKVLFAGEIMPAKQLNQWIKELPNALFANLYGPTEITVIATYYKVDRKLSDDESVPIGFPCKNMDAIVLNEKNERCKTGERGELCFRGTALSYGYYNNSSRTSEAFVQNPLNTAYPELIYRTGDIVHFNERGEIMFDGRKDFQVKHSGHRIELGEIETASSSLQGIERCCCLHEQNEDKLVLFYSGNIEQRTIRTQLAGMLSDYMLPNEIINIEPMPINLNGKIDRVLLKEKLKEMSGEKRK